MAERGGKGYYSASKSDFVIPKGFGSAPMVPTAASQLSPAAASQLPLGAAPMVPASAGRLSPAAPYFYPSNTPSYHGGPYLHHTQYLHPSTLRPVISFPTPNPTVNPNLSANPSAASESLYTDYPHDLQSPMPQPINSLLMPSSSANVNLSANPGAALHGRDLYNPQDLRHPMPHSVNPFPMQYPNANPNLSFNIRAYVAVLRDQQSPMPRSVNSLQAPNPDTNFNLSANTSAALRGRSFQYTQDIRYSMPRPVISSDMPNRRINPGAASAEPKHNEGAPNGRQNKSADVIEVYDSDSDDFVEEATPTYSKSNGKASSDSLKTGGKASSSSKGEASKGGKAFSAGKGGKGSTSNAKPPQSDAELKLQLDLPPKSKLLMNCEATEMLQHIHEHMAILSEDPKIKIPEAFDKAFQYAKEGNHFTAAKSVKQILEPLKNYGVTDGEICMIANIGPETIEEVYALIPSLKATRAMNEGKIVEALTALANIKASK